MDELEAEQPAAARVCPGCGSQVAEAARFCPTCGRALTEGRPEADFTRWLQAAWRLFVSNIPLSVGIALIVVVPAIAFAVISYFGIFAVAILSDPKVGAPHAAFLAVAAVLGLIVLSLCCVLPTLYGGVYACFLEGLRTGQLSLQPFRRAVRHWWALTWTMAAVTVAGFVCAPFVFLLIGIPLLLALGTLAWLTLLRIVDHERGGFEALSFAWRAMQGRLWVLLLYTLLVAAIANAGVMAMYIGVVITIPFSMAAHAAAYNALRERVGEEAGA